MTDDAIHLVVDGGRVVAGQPAGLDAGAGTVSETLAALAAGGRDGAVIITWCRADLAERLDPERWPALLDGPRRLLHLGFRLTPPAVLAALQAIDFDSPFVVPSSAPRRLTWLVSAGAGCARLETLRLALPLGPSFTAVAAAWADLGLRALDRGVFAYHDDRLLGGNKADFAALPADPWTDADLAALVAAHRGRKRRLILRLHRLLGAPPALAPSDLGRGDPSSAAPSAAPSSEVDVVIPTLGRRTLLADVLADLARQTAPPRRVVVVEQETAPARTSDGNDELGAIAAPAGAPYTLDHLILDRPGASRARNAGLDRCRSPWVLLLDDDVRLPSTTLLAELVATARRHGAAAVDAGEDRPGETPPTDPGPARPSASLGSGRALVRRAALEEVGGFDENLEGWGEDHELALRLHFAGHAVIAAPACRVVHLAAPAGGFRAGDARQPLEPWRRGVLAPKPSPYISYRRLRWCPPAALRGACCHQLLGATRGHALFPLSAPLVLPLAWLRWRRSLRAARALGVRGAS